MKFLIFFYILTLSFGDDPALGAERAEFMKEWDQKMQGFVPDDMVVFEIPPRGDFEFYELIDVVPSTVTGAWFLAGEDSKELSFQVIDPQLKIVSSQEGKKECIFQVEAKRAGLYLFKFTNKKILSGQEVVYTFSTGNSSAAFLLSSHISPVEDLLLAIQSSAIDIKVDSQFAFLQQESHFSTLSSANFNIFTLSLIESLLIISLTSWQVFYLKRVLDNRRTF